MKVSKLVYDGFSKKSTGISLHGTLNGSVLERLFSIQRRKLYETKLL